MEKSVKIFEGENCVRRALGYAADLLQIPERCRSEEIDRICKRIHDALNSVSSLEVSPTKAGKEITMVIEGSNGKIHAILSKSVCRRMVRKENNSKETENLKIVTNPSQVEMEDWVNFNCFLSL